MYVTFCVFIRSQNFSGIKDIRVSSNMKHTFSKLVIRRRDLRFSSSWSNTLRKHAYSNILKILQPKIGKFSDKNSDIFHISAQNIDCRLSLEPPRRRF